MSARILPDLSRLKLHELVAVYEGSAIAAAAWVAIVAQPRCQGAACQAFIERKILEQDRITCAAYASVRAWQPEDDDEAELRAQCLLKEVWSGLPYEEAAALIADVLERKSRTSQPKSRKAVHS